MWFIGLGVVLIVAKLFAVGPVANWAWWWVLSPFPLAAAWWTWSDKTGATQRRAMEKMDEKKEQRRRKALTALGIDPRAHDKRTRTNAGFQAAQARKITKVEGKREAARQQRRDSVIHSRLDSSHEPTRTEPTGAL